MTQIGQEKRDLICQRQEELRLRTIERMDAELDPMLDGLVASVKNPENRNQPMAARVLSEMSGLGGKGMRDMHVHGDVNATTNVDARSVVIEESDADLEAKIAELRKRLG